MTEPTATSALPPPSGTPVPAPSTVVGSISPAPTDAEVAAVMAAVEALWPAPVVPAAPSPPRNRAWRFSGRWWATPLPVRRDRPWR